MAKETISRIVIAASIIYAIWVYSQTKEFRLKNKTLISGVAMVIALTNVYMAMFFYS